MFPILIKPFSIKIYLNKGQVVIQMDAHTLMLQFLKESFQADFYFSSNLPATVEN